MKRRKIKPVNMQSKKSLEQKWSKSRKKENRVMENYSDIVQALKNKSVKFWCKNNVYSPQQLIRSLYQMDKGEEMIKNIRNN